MCHLKCQQEGKLVNKISQLVTYLSLCYPVTIHPTIPTYWLFQHNQPFPWGSSGNLTVAGGLLSMTNVSRAYAGEYVCNADNGVGGQPVRRVVRLNVLCKYEAQSPGLAWAV